MTSSNGRSGWGGLPLTVFFPGHFTRAHFTTRGLFRGRRGGSGAQAVEIVLQVTHRNFLSGIGVVLIPSSRKLRCFPAAV
jgi:hypothetical protein